MRTRFYATADGQAGLFFALFGLFVAWQSLRYPLGRGAQMGPGMFPLALGVLLVVVGLLVTAKAMRAGHLAAPPFEWRSAIVVTAAILVAGALLLTAGLFVAIPALVLISALAARNSRLPAVLVSAAALTVMAWLLFIVGLDLRIPTFWM